ncbi:FAD-binding and (Fe-S)-binding domain-containing protein [Thermocrispum sp.]|mgnify:CR=1 FL=1|jgi:FAD/FMN-containing dehydrogenase/Fe-S oxidoreductase|uniref:FAD-linked oxidase C-terminal domain-containing protein n=1 Tax=Thermocrispum agreste TaxID=37925 RepID=A0ABD6FCU5_9PSEU|nr:FAD-binding and (Fe-S)-binding domain-containing protein [Thermocrispum sp.]
MWLSELADALTSAVRGEVDFSARRRAEYSSDASNYRKVPLGVVFPRDADDVAAAVQVCAEHDVPITTRGGGTSIAGNAIGSGVVLDLSRHMNRIISVDPHARTARVEAGVVPGALNAVLAEYGLRFGPDPSTHARCTIGGMIGNDACGSHSVAWGRTSDNVLELDVLCYDGTRMTLGPMSQSELDAVISRGGRPGRIHAALRGLAEEHQAVLRSELGRFSRQVSGYALHHLLPENGCNAARALVGSEGTCVIVLAATIKLVPLPQCQRLIVVGFPDSIAAADAVPAILEHKPLTCEGMDDRILDVLRDRRPDAVPEGVLPRGSAWLLVDVEAAAWEAEEMVKALRGIDGVLDVRVVEDPAAQRTVWKIREDGSGLATRSVDGVLSWPGWEDAAVPPRNLGAYLRDFHRLLDQFGLKGVVYGHFGEGCLHVRLDFNLQSDDGVAHFRRFMAEAAKLVVAHGGTLSGEHGDGRARSEHLPTMYSDELIRAFGRFKAIWDPRGRLNPGVIVDPAGVADDLRMRHRWRTPRVELALREDGGELGRAVHRCVGVARCRTGSGGVMCPSYRATRDEKDSTRGRARVLQEMLLGETVTKGWKSPEVAEALDLCLSCKGCKIDCPVGVDMASYKSEYLYQRYKHRLRPASHYSMGWLPRLARIAAKAPRVVNWVASSKITSGLVKRMGGIAPQRRIPAFARRPFTEVFDQGLRQEPLPEKSVLLWPDTFTNYFAPAIGQAAVRVLRAAGFDVLLPSRPVCCGLTWLSTGQLKAARRKLRHALRTVAPVVSAGVPMLVLEPSCAALFRSDATELLPDDADARMLADNTYTLAELLAKFAPDWEVPKAKEGEQAALQVHCHQHAVMGAGPDAALLRATGAATTVLDAGCCGLAGNFGFERGHYEVSRKVAEQGVLPALAAQPPGTAVVADGFSCRTQFEQLAGIRSRHLAEVLAARLDLESTQAQRL